MERFLYTINEASIYKSLSELLRVKEDVIRYYILRNYFKFTIPDLIDIKDFFNFIKNNDGVDCKEYTNICIHEVSLFHLTSRINNNVVNQKCEIYNLFDALTQKTDISMFLESNGFEFEQIDNTIQTRYLGKIIDWSQYFEGNEGPAARMINRRLKGSNIVSVDKCINGFLFGGNISNNLDVSHIYYCPEIVENMLRVLNKHDLIKYWTDHSTPYIITFKSNIEDIVFDWKPNLNNKQKVFRIYRYLLYYLGSKIKNQWSENDNPIIRLKDEINVPAGNIISFDELH